MTCQCLDYIFVINRNKGFHEPTLYRGAKVGDGPQLVSPISGAREGKLLSSVDEKQEEPSKVGGS